MLFARAAGPHQAHAVARGKRKIHVFDHALLPVAGPQLYLKQRITQRPLQRIASISETTPGCSTVNTTPSSFGETAYNAFG